MSWKDSIAPNNAGWKSTVTPVENNSDESNPSVLMSAIRKGVQGVSGGFSDEAAGGVEALGRALGFRGTGGPMKNISFEGDPTIDLDTLIKSYETGRNNERSDLKRDEKYNPGVSAVSDIAGSVLSPINKISKGTSLAKVLGNAAATGAIQGAGRSESDDLMGLTKDITKDALVSGAFGAGTKGIGAGINYVGPKVGSVISGVREETLKKAKDIFPQLEQARRFPQMALNKIEDGKDLINASLRKAKQSAFGDMSEVTNELDKAGEIIPLEKIISPIKDKIYTLRNSKFVSEADLALADALEQKVNQNLMKKVTTKIDGQDVASFIAPENVDASTARKLYSDLNNLAQDSGLNFNNLGTAKSSVQGASNPEVASVWRTASRNAKESITTAAENQNPKLAEQYKNANLNYGQLKELEENLFNVTKNPKAFDQFLRRTDTVSKGLKSKISEMSGKNVDDLGTEIQTFNMFSNPTWASKSLDGSTSTSRTIPLSTAGGLLGAGIGASVASDNQQSPFFGSGVGAGIGALLGSKAGSTAALMKYMQAGRASKAVVDKLSPNIPFNVYLQMKEDEGK